MAFSPCLSRKRLFQGSPGRLRESSAGALSMAFSPCLSRKMLFQGSPGRSWEFLFLDRQGEKALFEDLACACDGLFPLPV